VSPRRPKGRAVNGILLLNKTGGMTSNRALQRAKRMFYAAKAGHTGSLDPLATGVLPLCFGESTKFSQFLLNADKGYQTTIVLGRTMTTGDADGETLEVRDCSGITKEMVEKELLEFLGDIEQIPPMYSALKHQGQPLYKLAREGKEVERKPRSLTIHKIELQDFRSLDQAEGLVIEIDVEILCSKGTYIRSIAEDLGRALSCGGHVKKLHRIQSGEFRVEDAITLDELSEELGEQDAEVLDRHLLPIDAPVRSLPALELPKESAFYFMQGQAVMVSEVYQIAEEGGMVRVFSPASVFLGLGQISDDGRVAPKRLIVQS